MQGQMSAMSDRPCAVHSEPSGDKHPAIAAEGTTTRVVDLTGDHGCASATRPFIPPGSPAQSLTEVIDRCVSIAAQNKPCPVCLVSSFRVHFGDAKLAAWEETVCRRFEDAGANIVILRAGNVVDRDGRCPRPWSTLAAWYPLLPAGLTSAFLSRDELFSAINRLSESPSGARRRQITLLGSRRPVRDVLARSVSPGAVSGAITALARVLSWLQLGRLAGLIFSAAARHWRPLQRWQMSTLRPVTVRELLGLCHRLNRRHVVIAGYNTGVTHFGWKYPASTVVSTVASGRLVRIGEQVVTVDAGVLLKRVVEELAARGKELYVVPNYSYISMGTTFMVPIHGSGSEVSTLGDTIEQALIYDPATDRIARIRRGDERFRDLRYNPRSGILVLRLRLRIRRKSRYFVKRSRIESPAAGDIWQTLSDRDALNIELRKSRAAQTSVEVSRYFTTATDDPEAMEVPRDSLGRLWDRLEENPVSSWLFHAFVRKFGFHVELFLNRGEFDVFWRWHATLPLSKLQFRLVKYDGLPHSPFDGDRISVDIFMSRRHSARFLSFMKERLPHARFNPGKHSL